jgi:RNA polymerase sigma-70 factor (ECF subfamily)
VPIDATLVERLYRQARAEQWHVPRGRFADTLEASAAHAAAGGRLDPAAIERQLGALHLEDLALACACAEGDEGAWEHFVLEQRPVLYRAANALDPSGGARDLADSLYADLFGLASQGGERQSLFRYFHGRSSLSTWLRAVLAQRHVDRLRANRRLEALPEEDSSAALPAPTSPIEPHHDKYVQMIQRTFERAVANLPSRDRLRLACYYAQELTLAQTGRLLGEHEATCSRQLARTRRAIRDDVEQQLRVDDRLSEAEIAECFASISRDVGPLDLRTMLVGASERKQSAPDRSK